ncbi:MAG: VanZ family protein [Bacteroidales bacterium]|nr:MAG: VanZ family protein [Bacteroidales bacterium]
MKVPILKTRNTFIKTIVWGIFILLACTLPADRVSKVSLFGVGHMDKVFHFLVYFIFSLILYFDMYKYKNTLRTKYLFFLLLFLIPLVWGIIIELIQFYALLSREGSFADIIANTGGIVTGVLFVSIAGKYLLKN